MRKLFIYMTMSMDGFIAGPNNELDWMINRSDLELNQDIEGLITAADTGIMGYPTASGMIPFWANVENDPNASQSDRALADVINRMHNVILSNVQVKLDFNNSELLLVKTDQELVEAINRLKQQSGKQIGVTGGVRTVQKFSRLGLVDEYLLLVHPVALGTGKALFTSKTDLELVSSKMYASGVLRLRYQPKSQATPNLVPLAMGGNNQVG
jgi:dihydrofolate reductase